MNSSPTLSLLSFPKTGRTWLKTMLKLYFECQFGLEDLAFDYEHDWHHRHPEIPRIRMAHDDNPHLKAVQDLSSDRSEFENDNVVLIVRDPRDVMVSLYFEMTKRKSFYEYWGFDTSAFVSEQAGLSKAIRHSVGFLSTYLAYLKIWENTRATMRNFRVLHYEAMHEDPVLALREVLGHASIPLSKACVEHAVTNSRFDKMRAYENSDKFASTTMKPGDPSDSESFKVRRGKVGGFTDYLSEDDITWIDAQCSSLPDFMKRYQTS